MSGFWIKTLLQGAWATTILFFGLLFLNIAGINIINEAMFSTSGIAIIFLFFVFNLFTLANWK